MTTLFCDDNTPVLTLDQRIEMRKETYHSLCKNAAMLRRMEGNEPAKLLMDTNLTIARMGANLLGSGLVTEDELQILSFVTEDEIKALQASKT